MFTGEDEVLLVLPGKWGELPRAGDAQAHRPENKWAFTTEPHMYDNISLFFFF